MEKDESQLAWMNSEKKTKKSNRGMSDTDSGRTREMVVITRENLLVMEEKYKT